jgi:hypothetical protein
MALKPLTYEDPLYQLLREGNVKEFNQRKAQGEKCELASWISAISTCAGSTPLASTLPIVIFAPPICAVSISQKRA